MEKLFRILWRINAVVILLTGISVCLICTVLGYYFVNSIPRTNTPTLAKADEQSTVQSAKEWKITSAERIQRGNIIRCELSSGNYYKGGSFSSRDTAATLNYLYYDLASGNSRWLLPTFNSVINAKDDMYFPGIPLDERSLRWTSFTVAEAGAHSLSYAIANPDGTSYRVLLKDVDEIINASLVDEFDLVVFYRKSDKSFVCRIDLKDQKIISTTDLFDKK